MANMFCGFYSTVLSAQAMWESEESKFITAAWLIVAAFIADGLDGKLARLTQSSSEFGIQYDSMADVISFGLAPSLLAYYVFFQTWGTIGLLISFIPLVFGSIRLARFNVRTKGFEKDKFEGLPIPAAALTIASFVIFNFEFGGNLRWSKICLLLLVFVSLLMVTNIRYEAIPDISRQSSRLNRLKIFIFLIAAIIVILFPQETFFPFMILYVLLGILRVIWQIINQKNGKKILGVEENSE
jgi:CDP-diacylglycerol--serine O-phosphatidyltransferase